MAEFAEVMKQAKRMCKAHASCDECNLRIVVGCDECPFVCAWTDTPERAERTVMGWAAENPEPKYPTWNEAWRQLFPNAKEGINPCPIYFMPEEEVSKFCGDCVRCHNRPIPADIAEKLGIKPIGGIV